MIKRILLTIVMLLLIAYLIAAVTVFNDKPAHQVCRDQGYTQCRFRYQERGGCHPAEERHLSRWKENGPGTHQNIGKRVG